jgi:hypothetical protein
VDRFASPEIYIFSEEFLHLLTAEERRRLQFRQVERTRPARKRFVELIGPPGPQFVAATGLSMNGWHCSSCGHRTFGCWVEGMAIHEFIAKDDLASPLPGLFTVGNPPEIHLCATRQRWHELIGKEGSRGFVSLPLGVVPTMQVVRTPILESLQSQENRR